MKKYIFSLLCILILSIYVFILLKDAGFFHKSENFAFGTCHAQGPIIGPEDMALIPSTPLIIISSDSRTLSKNSQSGDLFLYDTSQNTLTALLVHENLNFNFHPHGLDIISIENQIYIYVVNHRTHEHTTIEVFKWEQERLQFIKSISDPLFEAGNDIALIDKNKFYLTSDFSTTTPWKQKIQQYLRQASGYLSYYDGQNSEVIKAGLFFANGLSFSENHQILYIVSMLGKELHLMQIGTSPSYESRVIPVNMSIDNITRYGKNLIAAVHPNLFKLKKQNENRNFQAPSVIYQISDLDLPHPKFEKLYENSGKEISSASVALRLSEDRLIIGSVFDDHILDCRK